MAVSRNKIMSVDQITAIGYCLTILGLSVFVVYRLRPAKGVDYRGGGMVLSGLILIFLGSLVNLLSHHPDYYRWFLDGVYPFISAGEFILAALGMVLFIAGLVIYFSYLGDRDLEVANHIEKLKLLDNIQQDSRYPYPVMELLDRVLKSMLSGLEEEAGAVFLLNRNQKRFVLATGAGLSKEETALLEYYPWGRNLVSQAIEDETPMISADFRSLGGKAQLAASKFRSILVVPLISGRSKLGAMLFFSQESKHYSKEFISIVLPIAEWLAEKVEVNHLGRDFHKAQSALEAKNAMLSGYFKKLERVIKTEGIIPTPSEFAERCIGLIGADEVWLVGLSGGKLTFYGGTGVSPEFSDNFRTAMISAIAQNKAVVLNQEATDETGNSFIARASLLIPADSQGNALLLRNNNGTIEVSREDFQVLEAIASVSGMVISNSGTKNVSKIRSKGIRVISEVLHLKLTKGGLSGEIRGFLPELSQAFEGDAVVTILYQKTDGGYRAVYDSEESDHTSDLLIDNGEGSTGKAAALKTESALLDSRNVSGSLSQYSEENRNLLLNVFGERRMPSFQGDYPIIVNSETDFILSVFGFDSSKEKNTEHHRLLSLVSGLLNLRIGILFAGDIEMRKTAMAGDSLKDARMEELVDDLSAISGHCQLLRQDLNLTGSAASSIDSIIRITEKAAGRLGSESAVKLPSESTPEPVDINVVLKSMFDENSISGNLHMIEGRPLAVNLRLKDLRRLKLESSQVKDMLDSAIKNFADNVEDDEIVTVSTYSGQNELYVDISKHRENFPPVEPVVGFGNYMTTMSVPAPLKDADFVRKLNQFSGQFAFDRFSKKASYYSLKIPVSAAVPGDSREVNEISESLTIVAIDSQAVILDLLAAMCQSLGHKIYTARNGNDGLKQIENTHPDIVITDLNLPDLSGWELAGKIRSLDSRIPVIVVTGWGTSVEKQKMQETGVKYILHKPFRLEQLSELIAKARFSSISD